MSLGYGVSGFVDGYFKGRAMKNSWEDRKIEQKRNERIDQIRDDENRRNEERHDMYGQDHKRIMRIKDQSISDWDRQRENDDYFRKLNEDAWKMSQQEPVEVAASAPMTVRGSTSDISLDGQPPQRASNAAIYAEKYGFGAKPATTAQPAALPEPKARPQSREFGIEQYMQEMGADAVGYGAGQVDPRLAAQAGYAQDGSKRTPYPSGPEGARAQRTREGISDYYQDAIKKRSPMSQDIRALGANMAEQVTNTGINALNKINEPFRAASEYVTGRDLIGGPMQRVDVDRNGSGEDLLSPYAKAMSAENATKGSGAQAQPAGKTEYGPRVGQASKTPQAEAQAGQAASMVAGQSAPADKDAAEAGLAGMGVKPEQKTISDGQYDRGSRAALDRYMEVGAPMVLEGLIRRGEFDKAKGFSEWMQSEDTKAGMKDWTIAAAAATLGDFDKFSQHVVKAYNRAGYFSDGMTVNESKSGFTKDDQGNIAGARLVFTDTEGNEFEQVYDSPQALVKMGVTLLAPENAFEYYWKEQEAKQSGEMGALKEAAKEDRSTIKSVAIELFNSDQKTLTRPLDAEGNPIPPMTMDQAFEKAEQLAERLRSGGGGGQQVTAQPNSAPQIMYRP